eukprot:1193195-Prorocentrum_minimum.AAC.8
MPAASFARTSSLSLVSSCAPTRSSTSRGWRKAGRGPASISSPGSTSSPRMLPLGRHPGSCWSLGPPARAPRVTGPPSPAANPAPLASKPLVTSPRLLAPLRPPRR